MARMALGHINLRFLGSRGTYGTRGRRLGTCAGAGMAPGGVIHLRSMLQVWLFMAVGGALGLDLSRGVPRLFLWQGAQRHSLCFFLPGVALMALAGALRLDKSRLTLQHFAWQAGNSISPLLYPLCCCSLPVRHCTWTYSPSLLRGRRGAGWHSAVAPCV